MHHREPHDSDTRQPLLGPSSRLPEKTPVGMVNDSDSEAIDKFPLPSWVWYRSDKNGRRFPQSIAHRGFKAEHPENTMSAFRGAVEVGAHAIETDIHLSKDNVVVLSHDTDLKRCFDREEKIIDCTWSYLSTLHTKRAPYETMPRLADLLEYISDPLLTSKWILLDIKLDNDAETVMKLIASTLESVSSPSRPWSDRVVLGIWAAKFLPLCQHFLPGYPVSHIGFSTCYARQFLSVPNVSFNMLQKVLLGPIGARFIRDVKKHDRPLFAWTVNDSNLMRWSIQKELDGVITDDPKRFIKICEEWEGEKERTARPSIAQWLYTFWLYIIIGIFSYPFRKRFPQTVEQYLKKHQVREKATLKLGA